MSTGASREALVDNECLGKSRQVGDDGKSWSTGYLEHLQKTFRYLVNSPSPSVGLGLTVGFTVGLIVGFTVGFTALPG